MNNLKQYPFQSRTLLTLKGERWKDIPGFEGSYQVSNLGRVKSLDRFVPHIRCGKQFVRGRILHQNIKRHYNHYTGDYMVILQVTLMLENRRYEFSVRRLVYAAFKDPSVLSNNKRMVVSKDGDGYNCRLNNLKAIDNSEKQKRILSRGRVLNNLACMDHRTFKPTYSLWKPVHRCNLKGKILATYSSIVIAAKTEGYYEKGITDAAKGRIRTYKGYKWRYATKRILKHYIRKTE